MIDYYKILQVDPRAEPEVITAAYRRLARKYHPDMKESGSEEKMKLITEAYNILSDPKKREEYDRMRANFTGETSFNSSASPQRKVINLSIRNYYVKLFLIASIFLLLRLNPRLGGILAIAVIIFMIINEISKSD